MRSEADPRPAMAAHSGPLCLPVVAGRGRPLVFRAWMPGAPLVAGGFGAMVPAAEAAELVPEVLIVPMLAFDRQGYRLGYGGGFYDRTLAALRAAGPVRAIGLAFAGQEVAAVPRGPWDVALDLIVTEAGVVAPQPG
jgi:5-formyltetrahydrofolate cyclo-ligase